VKVLKEIIEEMNERLVEFAEVCNRLDLRFLENQAVWNNYHAAFCRYRELQADVIRQLADEMDPRTRRAREEADVELISCSMSSARGAKYRYLNDSVNLKRPPDNSSEVLTAPVEPLF
jgi:hypothetical protein